MEAPADLTLPGALDRFAAAFAAEEARVLAFAHEPERASRWSDEANRLGEETDPGPLHGVPLGIKDIFHVDGLPTGAGSRLPADVLSGPQGPAVGRLLRAGAFPVGKTATTEFAYFAPAATRNPHAPDHTPGGSSSGSAAAVASGQSLLALGTQTIGSIGRPAAFCGVVGFKPSYNRVELEGVIPLAPSLDHVGLFAPDLSWMRRGAAVLLSDWAATEPVDSTRRLRLGVPVGSYLDSCSAAGRRHFETALGLLRGAGHTLEEIDLFPNFEQVAFRHRRLLAAENALVHAAWVATYRELYHPATLELIDRGLAIDRATLQSDQQSRLDLRHHVDSVFDERGLDLWLSPPATGPAPRGLSSTGDPILNLPWTQAGTPTLVVPTSFEGDLPMGLQLAGRFGCDEELFARADHLAADLSSPRRVRG